MTANMSFGIGVTCFALGEITGINDMWPRTSKITSLLIAYPKTRVLGLRIAAIVVKESVAAGWRIGVGILGETWKFAKPGLVNVARAAGPYVAAVVAGYVVGAVIGTKITEVIWGEKGADKAQSLYTGQESPEELKHTLDYMAGGDMRHGVYVPEVIGRLIWNQITEGTHESWQSQRNPATNESYGGHI